MRDNYIDLCCFNFGKRSYVIMKNSVKIMFFEKIDGNYEMPILSFDLYDNVGKSLTVVNQNFFMGQLINRLNIAFDKGILSSDNEIRDFLNNMKLKIENDIYLKKLFKGSLMNKIDEQNYESNKREIIKYLDQFKIDMFINYNNVSFFNGSIDKGVVSEEASTLALDSSDVNEIEVIDDSDVSNSNLNENSMTVSDVVSKNVIPDVPSVDNNFNNMNSSGSTVSSNSFDEFINGQSVSVEESGAVDSNDYFSSLGSNHGVSSNANAQNNDLVQNNISYVDDVMKRLENNF